MSDRVTCYLKIQTPVAPVILDLIEEHLGGWDEEDQCRFFVFHEIKEGVMPAEIQKGLRESKTQWSWRWESSSQFGSGMTIFDGRQIETVDTDHDGDVVAQASMLCSRSYVEDICRLNRIASEIAS